MPRLCLFLKEEKKMDEKSEGIVKARYRALAPAVKAALERRGYEAYVCEDAAQAAEQVLSLIPRGSSVSWGGSLTLEALGIAKKLREAGYPLLDRDSAKTNEERQEIQRRALTCGTFLSSVNALSEDGTMFNIDGTGNRIAPIAYGPEQVVLVVGMNKVCRDAKAAKERARTVAAPANGMRLATDTPCAKTGSCADCNSPACICSQIVEMRRNRVPGRIKVVLVCESLGL